MPIEEVRAAIQRIQAASLRTTSIETLKGLLYPVFRGLEVRVPIFEPGIELFRGVVCDSRPVHLDGLTYPPRDRATVQRASRARRPVFYCATARAAVPHELHVKVGNTVAIGHFVTIDRLLVNRIGFTEATFRRLASRRVVPDYGRLGAEEYDECRALCEDFLSEVFTGNVPPGFEHRYKLSIAVAEKMFDDDTFDGFMYPTVPMWANCDNFALKPVYADRSLELTYAEFLRVTAISDDGLSVDVLDEAHIIDPDGAVRWLGHRANWKIVEPGGSLTMKEANGHWVARDTRGNVVLPT